MIQVRSGVFETNSSSTHVITIQKAPIQGIKFAGILRLEPGEFGWEWETYQSEPEKASYFWTAVLSLYGEDQERLSQVKEIIRDALLPHCEGIEFEDVADGFWKRGFVDHVGELKDFVDDLLESTDMLAKYIFGNGSIRTGNDNTWEDVSVGEKTNPDLYDEYYKGN